MLVFLARFPKAIAWFFTALIYLELLLMPVLTRAEGRPYPLPEKAVGNWQASLSAWSNRNRLTTIAPGFENGLPARNAGIQKKVDQPLSGQGVESGGPGQPEMQAFSSVNNANMVDLFSGDFSYSIPLLDVGGYPVNLGYRAGASMDQEASWVGLGWNINPGTISRNLRGLPDDFKGDSIRKVMNIRPNETVGVTAGADMEIVGFPQNDKKEIDTVFSGLKFGTSLGVTHNNYKGWGIEQGINASINSGTMAKGPLTGGLSIANSSMDGLSITPSLSLSTRIQGEEASEQGWQTGSLSIFQPYNSRSGLKNLQLSAGIRGYARSQDNQRSYGSGTSHSIITFLTSSFTPTISIPYTSRQFSFTGKIGLEKKVYHASFYISGYVSTQWIAAADTVSELPSYGYLHYQDGAPNRRALLDYNREKDMPYREKPATPHIAIPSYTYDAFSITGEGTGGMFRAYRGDIGFVYDHFMRTKDGSERVSVDIGVGDMVHGGVDLNINRAFTQTGPWLFSNTLKQVVDFKKDSGFFQAAYFRNPGEKSINSKTYYETLGGDDVVAVSLYQDEERRSDIHTTNFLTRYRNKRAVGTSLLTPENAIKPERDKRTQVISYLNAKEADGGALSKYIENYTMNKFDTAICGDVNTNVEGHGTGVRADYFSNMHIAGESSYSLTGQPIVLPWRKDPLPGLPRDEFSIRWVGRIKAPVTGTYKFSSNSDDGFRLKLNDLWVILDWRDRSPNNGTVSGSVNLVAGEIYNIEAQLYDHYNAAALQLTWEHPDATTREIPMAFLYPSAVDTFKIGNYLVKEKRVNKFRKENHISEISVLNNDGRRYIYGIPVYNLKQKETTFAVNGKDSGNRETGLVKYQHGVDNTAGKNRQGKDWYYNGEEVPAYAHSFLLSGILSADYSDLTGNGISEDDLGDAVKFNYSKICGIGNPFKWRVPAVGSSQATYSEGLRTDYRDDKGNYVYGEKELWYLHSIVSKTMIATFVVESRTDLLAIDEAGNRIQDGTAKRLKEINLYSKADFVQKGLLARPVKTVHFEYGYELCPGVNGPSTAKLTLKKVWFTYNGNKKAVAGQNPYVFRYSNNNPSHNIKSYDRWGNYKDPLQNPGSTVNSVITNAEYPYALQDSLTAARNAATWSLDSIFLPSGGSIKVDYESDDYAYVQNKRAMQLFKIVGLNSTPVLASKPPEIYAWSRSGTQDHLYVFIKVPKPVTNVQEVYKNYLTSIEKLYFKLLVRMPDDKYSNGNTHEYVSCYADISPTAGYGMISSNVIWIKMKGISQKGDGDGNYSPLVKAATQFLRLNLPSKAYPGSETGDNVDLAAAVKMLAAMGDNIVNAFASFDRIARDKAWAHFIDTSRSFVRLNNPYYKKYGGGHRVKRITIYDNWDKMTNQRAAVYGQEYSYTTQKEIAGKTTTLSSGVASYEPALGGEENPFHEPIEYVEKISALGPVTLGYSEEPLGESFFPSAGVGYSCVRVRTINYKKKKSANGYDETKFYTAYDFPVITDRSLIDPGTRKRFKPAIGNFLRINARHYLNLTQGFKIELNDMHGKLRSKASYPETDPVNYTSYTEHFYRTDNHNADIKRLSNIVMVMKPDGNIDTAALIGKDVELMMDMRQQLSVTNGYNVNLNTDMFSIPASPPWWLIPSLLNLAQREENIFRSAATVKIIQRYGILDSVVQVDKGSKISTKDLMYDSETGDVLLTRTQNEFNDPVYNFTYPSHWAYDGMGLAYKNIDVTLEHVHIQDGRIEGGTPAMYSLFTSGDEILIAGKQKTGEGGPGNCDVDIATFPNYNKIWCIDSSVLTGGASYLYFIDRSGKPYTGLDVSMKVIRSGRRNIFGAVGGVTSLDSLVKRNPATGKYELNITANSKIIGASSNEFKQFWKVEDVLAPKRGVDCLPHYRPLDSMRCVQVNGVNTGYQEIYEMDVNPYSGSVGQTRWTLIGLNCYECSKPAKWIITGQKRCAIDDNDNNTGYEEREEKDTALCSATYNQSRWIQTVLNCDTCLQGPVWKATGQFRCAKDANNNNTGYQERQEADTTNCGNDTVRWVLAGWNCTTCTQSAGWKVTGQVRCVKDGNNNNTGYQEREERDTSLCGNGATRWVATLNCSTCPQTPGWKPTGQVRCLKDGNNNNTGYQEREERDTTTCGGNAIRWVSNGLNCSSCPRPPDWQPTGQLRCVKDGSNNNTGQQEKEERDTVTCSITYNQLRWVNIGLNCSACPTQQADWQNTGNTKCDTVFHAGSAIKTGYVRYEQRDMSTCSGTSGETRWMISDTPDCVACAGGTACPPCTAENCNAENKKCINNICESGVWTCYATEAAGFLWKNYYRYKFSDGSWSTHEAMFTEFSPCTPGLPPPESLQQTESAAKNASTNKTDGLSVDIYKQPIENTNDQLYRSVLPKEKYILYKERQKNLSSQHPAEKNKQDNNP